MENVVFAKTVGGQDFKLLTQDDAGRFYTILELKKILSANHPADFGSPETFIFSFMGVELHDDDTTDTVGVAFGSILFVLKRSPPPPPPPPPASVSSVFARTPGGAQFQLDTQGNDGRAYTFRELKLHLQDKVPDSLRVGNPSNGFFVFAGKGLSDDGSEQEVATPFAGTAFRDDDTAKDAAIVDRSVICLIDGSPVETVQWTWGDLWSVVAYKNPLRWSKIANLMVAIADLETDTETRQRPVKVTITRENGKSTVEDYTSKSEAIAAAKLHFSVHCETT